MADYQYLTETGVIVPDTADTLETVRNEFRTAFGNDLDVSAETPQGVLITAETVARDSFIRNNADLANQINPNIAGGIFLDAIWALTGGQRFKATPSYARDVTLTGVPGTLIPAGAVASVGVDGYQYQLTGAVELDNAGNGIGVFQSVELGPFPAPIAALNQIVSGVLGWETVSNPYAAEIGNPEESDIAARVRRRATLGLQGVALPEAITSGVNDLPGVRSMTFRENVTNADVVIEGVTLTPHSIYVCVDGGIDNDIGLMLLRKKSLGAGWNGTTTINVVDPFSGQSYPVKFSRPDPITVFAQVTVRTNPGYADIPGIVRNAIVSYGLGQQDGEDGFIVGGDVSPFELAGAINRVAPGLYVQNLLLSSDGVTFSTSNIAVTIAQIATITTSNISVTVI